MTDHRWERVKQVVHEAIQLDGEERNRFVEEACGADAELRVEVDSLLDVAKNIDASFLESASLPKVRQADEVPLDPPTLAPGTLIGQRYRLRHKLGEGGMGQVWLADQTDPVRRPVALKLIRAGMYDEEVVLRFRAERQSLAIMDHPAIAKVFDAGTTAQGQPYFVMEYVQGRPITEYADEHSLSIRDRLELFIQVCEAVQHAHQKAVIHRDLKPANVLIVEVDGKPEPRIIDFGVAKAIAPSAAGETLYTHMGRFLGTPAYMSPEQVDPNAAGIDTRTDVYSLGVLLYVLLTGLRPFEVKQRTEPPIDELLRHLREDDPPSLSGKLRSDPSLHLTASSRGANRAELLSALRGDLDAIAMKAVERDRERRYVSPLEFAADLQRYLNHEPIAARAASTGYLMRKYIRRHRIAAGVLAGLVALLTAFSTMQAVQLEQIRRERDRANHERDRAARITDFMTGMFKVPDPNQAHGNAVTAREVLDTAAKDIDRQLANDPESLAEMLHVMASTYLNLGLYPRAEALARRALEARQSLHGHDDPKTLASKTQLGLILEREGHYADADRLDREALGDERRVLGATNALTLETLNHLSILAGDQGRQDEQERLAREALELAERNLGPEAEQTLMAMHNLAESLLVRGRDAEAEPQWRRLLDIEQRVWGAEDPRTVRARSNLALTLWHLGRDAEAERLYREVLDIDRRVLGPEHENTTLAEVNLAALLIEEGRVAEGEAMQQQTLQVQLRTLGPDHADTMLNEGNLADTLRIEGKYREAERLQRATQARQLRILGAEHPDTLLSQSDLSRTLVDAGRYAEAEQLARQTYVSQSKLLGADHPDALITLTYLGLALSHLGRYTEARQLFRDIIAKQHEGVGHAEPWSAWYDLACVAVAAGRTADALENLREAIAHGFGDAGRLLGDADLKPLQVNTEFQYLVAELKRPSTDH